MHIINNANEGVDNHNMEDDDEGVVLLESAANAVAFADHHELV